MNRRKMVVKHHSLRSGRYTWVLGVVGAVLVVFGAYEFGQLRAGHNRLEAELAYAALKSELKSAEAENHTISQQITVLETTQKIDREAYQRVEDQLLELQAKIIEQQEDLGFYRGIVASDDESGVRIQNFHLSRGVGPLSYSLRLVLAQAFRSDQQVAGHVELSVEGVREGEALRMPLTDLTPAEAQASRLNFKFRYFQDLKADLVLPAGFSPHRIIVLVKPQGKSAKTVEQSFDWAVQPG